MNTYDAVMIANGSQQPDSEEQYFEAFQHLVDTGLAWTLEGSIGRAAAWLIENGLISAGSTAVTATPAC